MKKKSTGRIFEIDFIRGIAVICMVYFHIIYDLKEFYGANLVYIKGYNHYIGYITGCTFIIVSGISSSFSKNNLMRGIKVFALAMILTAITSIVGNGTEIYFGILHLLGISMMLAHFIMKWSSKVWLFIVLLLSTTIISGESYINSIKVNYNYLMVLGLKNIRFYSADYYPLVPWFGVFLIGILVGKILYEKKKSLIPFMNKLEKNPINFIGKHSLPIYLVHQPIVLLVLEILKRALK